MFRFGSKKANRQEYRCSVRFLDDDEPPIDCDFQVSRTHRFLFINGTIHHSSLLTNTHIYSTTAAAKILPINNDDKKKKEKISTRR